MMALDTLGSVVSVSLSPKHSFSKQVTESLHLLAGLGVEGDAHCGALVRHRYRVKQNPTQPNLCQVHLLQSELFDELAAKGFRVAPGDLGENITTAGVDLLHLPTGTLLSIGEHAVVEVTGLRDPCAQINKFCAGLMPAVIERNAAGRIEPKAGIMAIVVAGGTVRFGDAIRIDLPQNPWQPLVRV